MWIATTDDEANFIFDLLADRENSTPALEYARWLEERGESARAEFLRLDVSPARDEPRLHALRQQLDRRWLATVVGRRFRSGDVVRMAAGAFQGTEGTVVEVDVVNGRAGIVPHFGRPTTVWVAFAHLQV